MKMPVKMYKGGIVQIVSSPDSSSTIWKSCTTLGRRNYLHPTLFFKVLKILQSFRVPDNQQIE